jgi:hypothetical protein
MNHRLKLNAKLGLAALTATTAAVAIALVVPAGSGAATSNPVTYSLAGTATMAGNGFCTPENPCVASAGGSASCASNCAGRPAGGSFSLDLPTITTYSNTCRIKKIRGTLTMLWDTSETSTANVSGHFIDSKPILTLSGTWPPGPIFPSGPIKIVLNNFPPNPCTAATNAITGTLKIGTSS